MFIHAQVGFATFLRPAPDAPNRWLFNIGHHNLGRLLIVCGWCVTRAPSFVSPWQFPSAPRTLWRRITLMLGIVTHHQPLYQTKSLAVHAGSFGKSPSQSARSTCAHPARQ
jgi:hypothetical protein